MKKQKKVGTRTKRPVRALSPHERRPVKKHRWLCPKCGSDPENHGEGGADACLYDNNGPCYGFVCECDIVGLDGQTDSPDHGLTFDDQCANANCYHCGWGGTFPSPPFKLTGWAKKAWDAGWRPPTGWQP